MQLDLRTAMPVAALVSWEWLMYFVWGSILSCWSKTRRYLGAASMKAGRYESCKVWLRQYLHKFFLRHKTTFLNAFLYCTVRWQKMKWQNSNEVQMCMCWAYIISRIQCNLCLVLKGHCHRLTCTEAFTPVNLKNSPFKINTFMAFRPCFLVFSPAIIFSFPSKLLLFAPRPESTSPRHIESAGVQLENIRLIFSSFASDARACQPVTVSLNNITSR